jgi:hypothetical protein
MIFNVAELSETLSLPSKKQEYEAMQFQEVRLLSLLSVSSQLHDEFPSSITSWINWLKCYECAQHGAP